jgi:hypothetical protein
VKDILVREAGGRCVVCAYDRNIRALEFHHLDRTTSDSHSAAMGSSCHWTRCGRRRASACSCVRTATRRWRTAPPSCRYSFAKAAAMTLVSRLARTADTP